MRSVAMRSAGITVRDLFGGLIGGVALGALADELGKPLPMILRRSISVVVAATALLYVGRWWGRDMARLAGRTDAGVISRQTSFGFAPIVIVLALGLAAAEPIAVARAAGLGAGIHIAYGILFVSATFLATTIGAFALLRGLSNTASASRLAPIAGLAAAAAFLTIAFLMDRAGWRVGAPNAGRRATMVVVTLTSISVASAVAGATIGTMLSRFAPDSR